MMAFACSMTAPASRMKPEGRLKAREVVAPHLDGREGVDLDGILPYTGDGCIMGDGRWLQPRLAVSFLVFQETRDDE